MYLEKLQFERFHGPKPQKSLVQSQNPGQEPLLLTSVCDDPRFHLIFGKVSF